MKMKLELFGIFASSYVIVICAGYKTTRMRIDTIRGCEHTKVPQQNAMFQIYAGTIVSCGAKCVENVKCNSFDYDLDNGVCFGTDVGGASIDNQCLNFTSDTRILHFEKFCLNNGYLTTVDSCKCVDGWVGLRCERLMKHCQEGFLDQGYKFKVYWVLPSLAQNPFRMKCMHYGVWYLMFRISHNLDFNRPWNDYKNGFGDLNGDRWIGLDNLYYLTNDNIRYVLYTYVRLKNGTKLRSSQKVFKIGDESTKYRMNFSSSSTTSNDLLGNCLDDLKGQQFTTYDQDNDNAGGTNCAQIHKGGYWFNNCAPCNPTGIATNPASGILNGDPWELSWSKDLGNLAPVRISHALYAMN